MSKYSILLNILDTIIKEAPSSMSKKYPQTDNLDLVNHARSRAFIHLFLKVTFGLLNFEEREHFITDGPYDGGIDGYYINPENKTVYYIQSKFRCDQLNFENKSISLSEILIMDVNRILEGETSDENGNEYNGKISQLQREVSNTENIARYSHQVVILANLPNIKHSELIKLTGGYACTVFDFEYCYERLVFPVLTGTFYNASDLCINIDLSNKNAGSKISYTVLTSKGKCEITVLFVPTIEVGRIMYKYKNSILKYNPRSYLGHDGTSVNNAIRETITNTETNEFALFNNGITMLSDETFISEKIGQKYRAQLIVKNPQIINGGQTSYTLSRIYAENLNGDVESIFENKEVLVKVITLQDNNNHDDKISLINSISDATNKQTPVINADRISNEKLQHQLQRFFFQKYGILFERKRGEFSDGVFQDYVSEDLIIERNLLYRMYHASNGNLSKAKEKKLFYRQGLTYEEFTDEEKSDNMFFCYLCYKKMGDTKSTTKLSLTTIAKLYALTILFKPSDIQEFENASTVGLKEFNARWNDCLELYKDKVANYSKKINKETGDVESFVTYDFSSWYTSNDFPTDVRNFFFKK